MHSNSNHEVYTIFAIILTPFFGTCQSFGQMADENGPTLEGMKAEANWAFAPQEGVAADRAKERSGG